MYVDWRRERVTHQHKCGQGLRKQQEVACVIMNIMATIQCVLCRTMYHSGKSSAGMEVAASHRVTSLPQLWPSTLWYMHLVSFSLHLDSVVILLQNADYLMSVCSTECDKSNIFVCFLKEKNSQYGLYTHSIIL